MTKTNTETVRKILAEFPNLQNEKKTLEGNHEMTFREAIRALYPTLRDMKKRGFSTKELAEKLDEYGVYHPLQVYARYGSGDVSEEQGRLHSPRKEACIPARGLHERPCSRHAQRVGWHTENQRAELDSCVGR